MGPLTPVGAQHSDVCERALGAADDQYVDAAYDEALQMVSACLNQSERADSQSVAAYRLLALIHLKRDELDAARGAVVNLLGVDPSYTADPIAHPPAYVSLVAIVRRDLQPTISAVDTTSAPEPTRPPFFRRTSTWVTIGGIVVGSGVATVFAVGGGSEGRGGPASTSGPLPVPPGTP